MSLPIILDVAIALIFVYLILSLLASEIQELIATILQWRAKHLKESIENLLAGGTKVTEEGEQVRGLVNQLYDDPLIKNINQEAKGFIENLPRRITWCFAYLYRLVNRLFNRSSQSIFGDDKHSGPSYITGETFATTLLETLHIPTLSQKLSESRLEKFKNEQLEEIKNILERFYQNTSEDTQTLLKEEFDKLDKKFGDITQDFKNNVSTLDICIDRIAERLSIYIENSRNHLPEETASNFDKQMTSFKQDIFNSKNEQVMLLGTLKPSLTEIADIVNKNSAIYSEIIEAISDKESESYKRILEVIDGLPVSVKESLAVLSRRAQAKVQRTEEDINQLRQEIEVWFDRSMDRASGVYKRNAKLVAILVGFLIAVATNADTLNIVNRSYQDPILRGAITQRAEACSQGNQQDFQSCIDRQNLEVIDLPIGWTDVNKKQQGLILERQQNFPFIKVTLTLIGWILSALAISMGAAFWFDLLSKVMNVRNAGKKPISSTEKPPTVED